MRSSNNVTLIAVSEFSAGKISIVSPLTLKAPREKSKSLRSYCIETKRKIILRCNNFSPLIRCMTIP